MSPELLAQDPTLADFGHDPWWLILIKIVVVFIFGMSMILLTLCGSSARWWPGWRSVPV